MKRDTRLQLQADNGKLEVQVPATSDSCFKAAGLFAILGLLLYATGR